MKRRRRSVDCTIKRGKEVNEPSPFLCSFIKNIPETILVEIFLRLPIKEIIMCKSVCNMWYHLIRMPQFAKQHFGSAQQCAVVKRVQPSQVSRMLYLIEPHKVNVTYCHCDEDCVPCKHQVSLKLETAMKIPLRNIELLPSVDGDLKTKCSGAIKKRCTKASPALHKFGIVNSCNGFICLSEPQSNNPMAVCNPVTGEYINLPGTEKSDGKIGNIVCGFGYSPKLNKYKVIRIFVQQELQEVSSVVNGGTHLSHTIAETYTFGKGSWERIGYVPVSIFSYQPFSRHVIMYSHQFPIYCNGAVNWLHFNYYDETACIRSFDVDNDCFESIELPLACDIRDLMGSRLGELGGCLCLFVYPFPLESFTIWVMKKHGSPSIWTKMITVDEGYCDRMVPFSPYLPISYAEDESLLMFSARNSAFVHLNGDDTYDWKYLKIRGVKSEYEAYLYVPTLVSLKDALKDEDEILNVNTKDIKLLGESRPIFLEEDIPDLETPTENSDPDQSDEDSIWDFSLLHALWSTYIHNL